MCSMSGPDRLSQASDKRVYRHSVTPRHKKITVVMRVEIEPSKDAFAPKDPCDFHGINLQVLPPSNFIASLMHLSMVTSAERHGELIADLEADRTRLRKPKMMGVRWLPPADEARL